MRASIGCIATLMGPMGVVTDAAAGGSNAGFAGKRGLSPLSKVHGYREFSQRIAILLAIIIGVMSGCARQPVKSAPEVVPEVPATQFQSSLGRVALAVRVDLPALRFMRVARDKKLVRGSAASSCGGSACSGVDIGTCVLVQALLCGLVVTPIAAIAAEQKAEAAQSSEASMTPMLGTNIMQDALRDAVIAAAQSAGVKLSIALPVVAVDEEGEPDYRSLAEKGVDSVLEVTLHQVFLEPPFSYEGKLNLDPVLPLDMQTRVRLLKTSDNSKIFFDDYSYHGKRYQYTAWAANSGEKLASGLKKGYASLGRDISDRIFLLYPFADRIGNDESGFCGLGALEPKDNLADGLSPLLSWKSFPRASDVSVVPEDMLRVKNVRYELVVGSGENGETPDVFYHVEGLTETSHRVPMRLEPNTRYFWSVRARFDLDGRMRVTDWATYCPFGRQLVVGGRIYRFYTPKVGRYRERDKWVKGPL